MLISRKILEKMERMCGRNRLDCLYNEVEGEKKKNEREKEEENDIWDTEVQTCT
jgi:hypothetical protein